MANAPQKKAARKWRPEPPPTWDDFKAGGAQRARWRRYWLRDTRDGIVDYIMHHALSFVPIDLCSGIGSALGRTVGMRNYREPVDRFGTARPASRIGEDGASIVLPNGPEMATAFVAISAGATSAPLNPAYRAEELEFYSIKVPDGPLTSKLQNVQVGEQIILRPKPVGTLVHDALTPGKRLWFLATGTGFAPFASLLREPETWEKYDSVVMMHTCREAGSQSHGSFRSRDSRVAELATRFFVVRSTVHSSDEVGQKPSV